MFCACLVTTVYLSSSEQLFQENYLTQTLVIPVRQVRNMEARLGRREEFDNNSLLTNTLPCLEMQMYTISSYHDHRLHCHHPVTNTAIKTVPCNSHYELVGDTLDHKFEEEEELKQLRLSSHFDDEEQSNNNDTCLVVGKITRARRHFASFTPNMSWYSLMTIMFVASTMSLVLMTSGVSSASSSHHHSGHQTFNSSHLIQDPRSGRITLKPSSCDIKSSLLNLTSNSLLDISFLSSTSSSLPCSKIESVVRLDLSYNKIRILGDRAFTLTPRVEYLNLANNMISRVEETSLVGIEGLKKLDLSNNQLLTLPPKFFHSVTSSLKEVFFNNNSIHQLPADLFKGLSKLFVLNLSHNELSHSSLTRESFLDLVRVVILDLSHNRIKKINGSIFESQYSLQVLNLQANDIQEILPNAFSSLYNLDTLSLTSNSLKSLGSHSLNGLFVLKKLFLNENEISRISEDAFANCSSLTHLSLDGNLLMEIPRAVSHLKRLKVLNLRDNAISEIVTKQPQQLNQQQSSSPSPPVTPSPITFQGLQQLEALDLSLNKIVNVSRGSFFEMPALKDVDLSGNHLRSCDHGVFDDAPQLTSIHLQSNHLADINGLFMNLGSLRLLNVSRNKIAWFDYALIPKELTHLDLHMNKIEELGNYFDLSLVLALKWLDVSRNSLSKPISVNTFPQKIEEINLESNLIPSVHQFSFRNKANLKRVNLRNNSLTALDSTSLQLDPSSSELAVFFISNNPFSCDCNMEWMQAWYRGDPVFTLNSASSSSSTGRYPNMIDLPAVTCKLPTSRDNSTVSLLSTDSSNFLCEYKSHCFALCHCCDFDACDCEMTCPDNCKCYYEASWGKNIVDCSATPTFSHKSVPSRIPMDVTELYLDGNEVHSLSPHTFIGRKNLKVLHLNNSEIHVITNRTFNGLKSLQILNLSHNKLQQLHGYEFEMLFDLKELYLSFNRISVIGNNTFSAMRSLKVLHLDHNSISEFSMWSLSINSRLVEITLAYNMYSCECRFLKQISSLLSDPRNIVMDAKEIQCFFNESTSLTLLAPDFNLSSCSTYSPPLHSTSGKGFMTDLSSTTSSPALSTSSSSNGFQVPEYIPVFIIIGCVIFIILVSVIVLGVYRKEVSVWFYSRYGVRLHVRDPSREEEKLFDCFISYSKKDEAFVTQILAPELEYGNPPFRLCLHYRDLPVASGYLSDAIVQAMEASRRSILVISENFLKNEWCRYEFKSAHLEVLRTNQRHKLILIFIGKINTKDFDPDIRFWLKTSTFLQWGEKMFWEKLRYAMPDVSSVRKPYPEHTTTTTMRDMTVAMHV